MIPKIDKLPDIITGWDGFFHLDSFSAMMMIFLSIIIVSSTLTILYELKK